MRMKLTNNKTVDSLIAKGKAVEVSDSSFGGGMFILRVGKKGGAVFEVRYRFAGVQRRHKLGDYGDPPGISLSDARDKAREVLLGVKKGIDPEAPQPEPEQTKTMTFRDLWNEYMERHVKPELRSAKYTEYVGTRFILPSVGDQPLPQFDRADVMKVIDAVLLSAQKTKADPKRGAGVVSRDGRVLANLVRGIISSCFGWGMTYYPKQVPLNPVQGTPKPLKGRKAFREANRRVLRTDELKAFWKATEKEAKLTMLLLRFLLLTATRQAEVKTARWRDIDTTAGIWRIPAQFYKTGIEHTVPLPRQALDLLGEVKGITGEGEYLFPGLDGGPRLSTDSARKRLRENSKIADLRLHWFRHTAMTTMIERLGIPQTVADLVLGHTPDSAIAWTYDLGDYFDKKRDALQKWSDFVEETVKPKEGEKEEQDKVPSEKKGKVVSLRAATANSSRA